MLRFATREDIPVLLDLCVRCHEEYPDQTFPLDYGKAEAEFPSYIDEDRSKKATFVTVQDGQVVGLLIGLITEVFYSNSKSSYEVLWWVRPEYRKRRDTVRLFEVYEYWAKQMGCDAIQASYVHSDIWTDLTKFYTKRGYKPLETSFRLSINNGN